MLIWQLAGTTKNKKKLEMQQGGFFEIPVPGFLRRISRPQGSCEIPRSREYQGILGILGRPASLWKMSVKLLQNLSVFVYINRDISEVFFLKQIPESRCLESKFPTPKIPGECQGGDRDGEWQFTCCIYGRNKKSWPQLSLLEITTKGKFGLAV